MLTDPFYLHHIVTANAEIATALDNLFSDDPDYEEKHEALLVISKRIETAIVREVTR